MRYAVTDPDGLVVNVILWDGTSDYNPGDGLTLTPLTDDAPIGPGDTIAVKKGKPVLIDKAEPEPVEPTLEERIAALEAKVAAEP